MTHHTQPPAEIIIFITHVEADDVYLKVWGQLDKHAATCVERFIHPLINQFAQGYGCPSKSNRLIVGALCCARFQTDGYYRAKILDVRPDGMIIVQFIDYGNMEILPPHEVHLLEAIAGSESLQVYPAMAAEFTLLNVLPINGVWENRTVEMIRKSLCYNEYRAYIHPMINNHCLIKILYNNEDFGELLVRERMALPANLQDMFRPKHMVQPHMPMYQQNKVNFVMAQNTNVNQNTAVQGMFHKTSPDVIQHKHTAPQPLPVQEALVFKSRVLDVGSKHEVVVSCVEDGPQKFSVQVQSTTEILNHLMNDINNRPKRPLQEPPLPGSVCLGRYTLDKVLCRAVVMSVMEHKCKLYYVDFGHTEILPYTDIFQLPPEFINPKVLSIRFTLSGLKELHITQEMKDYFQEIVSRKLLILHVRPPEGPPLIQYGDLYDNGINIKDLLKKAFPAPVTVPATYSYPQLQRLPKDVQEIVHVSFVESCKKFYVQLDNGIKSLDSVMSSLGQYAETASAFNATQLKVGLPCAALYDSQWYRAQILDISGDKIKVVYVDYGNEEVLPVSSLCSIHDDLVRNLPAQAIKCALNGYEVLSSDQEVTNHFEKLILEKRFFMKVVASQSNGLLIDLFEFETMRSIHPQLLNNPFCDKIENSTANSQTAVAQQTANPNDIQRSSMKVQANSVHRQRLKLKTMNISREDKDKYNRKSNDSWNRTQNAKSFQENKPNSWREEWPQEKQHDNRRERTAPHFNRDGSQKDRFSKDEFTNNRSGRDRSYNKYDKNEINTPNRSAGGAYQGGRNRFSGSESRYTRNGSTDKAWSDKDSDTSSKGSGRHGKGGFNRDGRGGKRDAGMSNRLQTTRDNNRPSYKNGKFNGDYSMCSNKFKDKEQNTNNISYDQINTETSWDIDSGNKESQNELVTNRKSQFPSMHIVLGAMKNCEMVFSNSPSDFFIQLHPDYLELESVMKSIAEIYENSGEVMQSSEIQPGTCCIAQYEEDLQWYRAVIKSIEGNNATVEFVDYGNTELVDFMRIKVIQEEFLKLPMQAIHCKLLGLSNTGNKETEISIKEVEGKSLEVEFVCEENEIYEVLLREIVDGVSKASYINEEFCTINDLTKAKESTVNKKLSNTMTKKIIPDRAPCVAPDYATFDTKWQTITYESKSKNNVIVTWFINPNKFYCQILSKEVEFKTMMNEIQKTYAGREPVTHKLEVGTAIIAIFSEDGALYRAEVVSNNAQKGYIVQYIDFGNCATVNHRNIYPVENKFMRLPRLSVQCSLKDIIPNNNSNWSEIDNVVLDNCFNADKYECIFHDFKNDLYTVSLIHNGQNVGDMLVQKNLAESAMKTTIEIVNDTQASNVEIEAVNDMEKVDISLLSGQTLRVTVSSVESTTRFHVQLPSASRCGNIINKYMDNENIEVMPRLSSREMCLGAGCLVNANGTWRRAVVINCSRSVGFDVKLIDTGAYDEILDGALALPGALAAMQNQALECSLQNVPASLDVDKQLKELVEGKEVLVYVEKIDNNRLIVKLYDTHGNRVMGSEEDNENISPVCSMPILSSTHKVSVSCIDHTASIWLQRYSDYELDTKLMENLEKHYSCNGQKMEPEIHLFCAAKSVDGRWYRGKIVKCNETTAYVNYVDYGNTEEIPLESIMVLEPQFYQPYQLAINVSLSITLANTAEEVNDLQTHLLEKELMAVFYNVHNKWIVDLIENEVKLSDKFRSLNLLQEEQLVQSFSKMQETSTSCKFDVIVSHVDSPSQFWLQRIDEVTPLKDNQTKLQLEVSDFPTLNGIPEEGTLCVAVYSIDNCWYRAEVLDADEEITTIRFIDYGNTDVVNNEADHIRQIPDAWQNVKKYAHKCRLDVIPIGTEDWSESTCKRFDELMSVDTLQAVIVADTMPKRVELFVNDKSISEMLVEEKHAIIINAEQAEPVDEIIDLELDPHSAFVCHINSPNEFWVQEEKSVADLEVMADRFMVADMFSKIDDVKEGLLYVAKYPEDAQWYRARVLSHNNNETRVIYIDYGNSSVSTEIRILPEDLANIPPLSRKCCLELPPHIKEWSEQACEEFIKLAADGATIFLLDVLKEQETSLVKLTLDDENVTDILVNLCEQNLPVIEERLPPLGEENSPNVMVSHVNSPSEFWIQAESSISELEVMSDRLRDAESFLTLSSSEVDTICAARYPEDGYWYRAKIIACHKEGVEVLYIDYGNSAVTEELRVLPEDIINIPVLSKRCTLEKPSYVVTWSEKACEKFKELAAEGATMFQFETLDKNDPIHVQLSLNGANVVELLVECENNPDTGEAENEATIPKQQEEIISGEIINNDEHASPIKTDPAEEFKSSNSSSQLEDNVISKTTNADERESNKAVKATPEIQDTKEVLSITSEATSTDIAQIDANQAKCIPREESPQLLTSKTSHSEKLVAGVVNPIKPVTDLIKEQSIIEQESIINQTDSSNNLSYVNQTEKLENTGNDEAINKSVDDSNIDERREKEEQDYATNCGEIDESTELNKISEIIMPLCISETNEVSKDFNITNVVKSDNGLFCATTTYVEESSVVTELSVDDIVGNMMREDSKLREIDDVHLLDATDIQSQTAVQDDASEQQEAFSHVQHDINNDKLPDAQISKTTNADERESNKAVKATPEIQDTKEVLSSEATSTDIAQIDANQAEKQEISSEMRFSTNDSLEVQTPKMIPDASIVSCLPKEQTEISEQTHTQSSTDDKTVAGSTSEDNLKMRVSTNDSLEDQTPKMIPDASIVSCLPKEQMEISERTHSQSSTDDKTVAGSTSEDNLKMRVSTNDSLEDQTPKMIPDASIVSCLPKEQTEISEQTHSQSSIEDKTVAGSTSEDNLKMRVSTNDSLEDQTPKMIPDASIVSCLPKEQTEISEQTHSQSSIEDKTVVESTREDNLKMRFTTNDSLEVETPKMIPGASIVSCLPKEQTEISEQTHSQSSTEDKTVVESTREDNLKMRFSTNDSLEVETPKIIPDASIVSCLPKKQTEIAEQTHSQSSTENKTVAGSTSEDNVKITSEITSADGDINTSLKSTSTITAIESSNITKTDPVEESKSSNLRSRLEDNVVPIRISEETSSRPRTPKTSHSEKLVAGVVNPVDPIADCMNENDEILTVAVENNIPKHVA